MISLPREEIILWLKRDGSCKSKKRKKQANYLEINHISTVLN